MQLSEKPKTRELHLVLGRAGMGKSTRLVECWRAADRAIVLDVLGGFNLGLVHTDPAEVLEWFSRGPDRFRVVFRPGIDLSRKKDVYAMADWMCKLCRAIGPVECFLDEIDAYCSSSDLPPNLDTLIRYGRHAGVTLRAAVRRPRAVIPRHYVTETTRMSMFRTVDPADRDFLAEFTGVDSAELGELEPFHYIEWCEGAIERRVMLPDGSSSAAVPREKSRKPGDSVL